jgi:hypothetical protein
MIGSRCQIAKSGPNISAQNSAHVTKPIFLLWLENVLIAESKGARIVGLKRSESSKALDFLGRRPCGDNTAVRMIFSTVLEWWVLPKAVKEMDCRTSPFCLPSRDEGSGSIQ